MVKRIFISVVVLFILKPSLSKLYSQYDDPIPTIKYHHKDTIEEKNIMNLTRDTVFSFYLDSKPEAIINSDKFYLKQGKIWVSYRSDNELIEKGRFKRWKAVTCFFCLLVRPKYWSKVERKLEHNGKIYLPRVKVGNWDYYDKNGNIIKTLTFNRDGRVIAYNGSQSGTE